MNELEQAVALLDRAAMHVEGTQAALMMSRVAEDLEAGRVYLTDHSARAMLGVARVMLDLKPKRE